MLEQTNSKTASLQHYFIFPFYFVWSYSTLKFGFPKLSVESFYLTPLENRVMQTYVSSIQYREFFFLSHFDSLPFRGMSLWSQGIYPSLPRYTPCILVSRIGSALPHRVNSHQTTSVDYFVCSRSHAFHGRNHTFRRKNPTHRDSNPRFLP